MGIHDTKRNRRARRGQGHAAPHRGRVTASLRRSRWLASSVVLAAVMLSGGIAAALPGAPDDLRGVVRKTIFDVEVARIRIQLDGPTLSQLGMLTRVGEPSDVSRRAVRTVLDAKEAIITTEFLRDVPYDSYLESAHESLEEAAESGLISPAVQRATARLLPAWFAGLGGRGPREGDRLACSITASSVRLVYPTADGKKLVDETARGKGTGRAILASYFIPGTDLEEELIESLFR